MKSLLALATLSLALAVAPGAQAFETHRNAVIYGPAGGVSTVDADRVCYDGVCTYDYLLTGPEGYTLQSNATTMQVAPGSYERNVQTTGPRGYSANRTSTLTIVR
ncbi:MAG: hypothetical protein KDJ19_12120 [Hyphomicrobiaceae bacterium]|nr:hypothetical protein [Hyphomicrobiaceae bacterium]MCC0022925.1 hypothetical protein [Hyphomicrobiaceae bacterium]